MKKQRNQKQQREDALKNLPKTQFEKDRGWKRAEEEIKRIGYTGEAMEKQRRGLQAGGTHNVPFRVMDADSVWEMMENGVSSNKIVDYIYDTKGKLSLESQYVKNQRKNKNKDK